MRVLITGATGFVGGWLAAELLNSCPDAELWGTAHGPAMLPEEVVASVRLMPCDLTHPGAVAGVIGAAQPEQVFHLAGFASAAGGDAAQVYEANVGGTVNLLRALEQMGRPCRVLLASSGYVYGATRPGSPATEDDPPAPRGIYAESKAAMEQAARRFEGRGGLSITVVRSFNHTGPRQSPDFVVPAFSRQIARIERGLEAPVVRVGNLEAKRDFLSVRDVVRAYRLLMMTSDAPPWRVVNVCSGTAVSIQGVLDGLLALARVPLAVEADPTRMRPSEVEACVGSPSRLTALTSWHPHVPLDLMLIEVLDWWRQAGLQE